MVECDDGPASQIPQFYAGRSILITGGTGFMGKVLVERLLTTCPDVHRLYLLVRDKKGATAEERLQLLKESEAFDTLRRDTDQLDKLVAVAGDITQPQLAIRPEDFHHLKNVSLVIHSAATLKFDEPLQTAVQQNVRSVIHVMDVCDSLPNIQAFVYVSTAYSNAERRAVGERVYAPHVPLAALLALAAHLPGDLLAHVTAKYIYPKPNTYTFTKAMAESVVEQRAGAGYAVAIFRPTIVVSALQHPHPGWVENLNGPSGVVAGAGKGLLHVLRCRSSAVADVLPVDLAIHALLAVAWETAVDQCESVRVYNCSTSSNPTTWGQFEAGIRNNLRKYPLDTAFWYPSGFTIENRFIYKLLETCLQTVPLHLAEYAMRLFGIKSRISMLTVNSRLQAMNTVLAFFALREWTFHSEIMQRLQARLTPRDASLFNMDPRSINWDEHNVNFVKGVRRYLLKEKEEDIAEAKRHMRKLRVLHYGLLVFVFLLVFKLLLQNRHFERTAHEIWRLIMAGFSVARLI